MTEKNILYDGLSAAAWGYFFLHVDFKIGPVSLLPAFVGWLLLFSALGKLAGARRDLALLRPLGLLLFGWSLLDWLFAWAGRSLQGAVPFLDLLTAAAGLYFHYQFLTDMAALAEDCQEPEDNLDQRLRRRRTWYLLLTTAAELLWVLPGGWRWAWQFWAALGLGIAGIVVAVLLMAALFALRRYYFRADAGE